MKCYQILSLLRYSKSMLQALPSGVGKNFEGLLVHLQKTASSTMRKLLVFAFILYYVPGHCFRGDRRYRLKMRRNVQPRSGGSARSGPCTFCVGCLRGEGSDCCKGGKLHCMCSTVSDSALCLFVDMGVLEMWNQHTTFLLPTI